MTDLLIFIAKIKHRWYKFRPFQLFSLSLSLSSSFVCSSWPSLRPLFTSLDYDSVRGQVLNRIPFAFAVMRARREQLPQGSQPCVSYTIGQQCNFSVEVGAIAAIILHASTSYFTRDATKTSSMPSGRISFVGRSLLFWEISQVSQVSWDLVQENELIFTIYDKSCLKKSRKIYAVTSVSIQISFRKNIFSKERKSRVVAQFSTMVHDRYELFSRTNQTKLKVYNRVSNSDRYEVK